MATITRFEDIQAWQKARELTRSVYQATNRPAFRLDWPLRDQIRRAAVSVMSNIAEGFSRQSFKEKVTFYSTSLGALTELQNQLLIARDVGYISNSTFSDVARLSVVVHKLLNGLIKKSKSIIHDS